MNKIATVPNTENEDNNITISRKTDLYSGIGELHKPEDLTKCLSCGYQNLAGSNFCVICGSRINPPPSDSPTFNTAEVSLAEFSGDGESEDMLKNGTPRSLSGASSANTVSCEKGEGKLVPTLTRTKNGEKTVIEKPLFKIGTFRESCDMVIADNRYISRIHAHIAVRNGRYFIIDQNSTNKTYVDGKAIPAETEVEIFDNTRVRLANEDMVFNIENTEK